MINYMKRIIIINNNKLFGWSYAHFCPEGNTSKLDNSV